MSDSKGEVTRLLEEWSRGDREALDKLMTLVYDELRQIARNHLSREDPGHTLQPTVVVHEACVHLLGRRKVDWKSRAQFFSYMAEVMRRILVDHARKRQAARRGGGATRISFDEAIGLPAKWNPDLVAVDDAIRSLEAVDPRQSRIVVLRFFGGLTEEEIGAVLGVSSRTVKREWRTAKLWLHHELSPD
ncbi:MAG: sigma-70 family RNA polymerase sigma factor [bacterium]|nr:sigma-70 family RNA polymerase sigma factor [bacterium]